jgi:hypothetical protein
MSDRGPEPNDSLSPYYPSETPSVPGDGRTWFALLLTAALLSGVGYGFASLLVHG